MSEKPQKSEAKDYSKTLFLPQTEFPMRAGLPQREPEILKRWYEIGLYARLPAAATSSCCMTARPMPTATSISARR
jgi:isoleucyl-tRNA synthetase